MMEIEKLKKASVMSRRMYLISYMANKEGTDIFYLFGLLNMYNAKNKGKWFWQKASLGGVLKDSFEKFNVFMDKFSQQLKSYDENTITEKLSEGKVLLLKLISDLETNLVVNREMDETSVRSYIDMNIQTLINESLKGF